MRVFLFTCGNIDSSLFVERVNIMNENKITAIYCRLSREDEKSDVSGSVETQKY